MHKQPTEQGPTSAVRPVETLQLGDKLGAHVPSGLDSIPPQVLGEMVSSGVATPVLRNWSLGERSELETSLCLPNTRKLQKTSQRPKEATAWRGPCCWPEAMTGDTLQSSPLAQRTAAGLDQLDRCGAVPSGRCPQ